MSRIIARLFGGMELRDADGRELSVGTRKARALLAFLMLEQERWHSRTRLAALLWGDRQDVQARNSLNQALYEIRKIEAATGARLVERQTDRVRFIADSIDCDVQRFEALLSADPISAADLSEPQLLERLDLAESDFRAWLDQKRTQCHEKLTQALHRLATSTASVMPLTARLAAARRLVVLEPLDEAARRHLMVLLAEAGDRVEAVRQYEVCASLLRDELGLTPSSETRHVVAQIRQAPSETKARSFPTDDRQGLVDKAPVDERPVVAVLPFANLSDDSKLAPFADGLSDDLILALARLRWFRVLARTSTFTLREMDVDPLTVRRLFGASHVVAGRVRRAGNRLRVTVELTDARNGQQVWATRYDKSLDDLFDVQDEITRNVAAGIEPALEDSEMRRTLGCLPNTLTAYDLLQRGYWHLYRATPQEDELAGQCFEAALQEDPNYAGAYAGLAHALHRQANTDRSEGERFMEFMTKCRETAAEGLKLDPYDPRGLRWFGGSSSFLGDQEVATDAFRRAIELAPSYATLYSGIAFAHDFQGDFAAAGPAADQTIRLRPHDPSLYKCIVSKAIARYQTGDYVQAEKIALSSLRGDPCWWLSNLLLAASAGQRGRTQDAEAAFERIRSRAPRIGLDAMLRRLPFVNSTHIGHLAEGMRRAGWKDVTSPDTARPNVRTIGTPPATTVPHQRA